MICGCDVNGQLGLLNQGFDKEWHGPWLFMSFLIKSVMLWYIWLIKSESIGFFSICKNLTIESKKLLPMKESFYRYIYSFF
jgi:hypothetical protein